MPFIGFHSGVCSIDLNVNVILEELNIMLEKDYVGDMGPGSIFWSYVCKIEDRFNVVINSNTYKGNFWEWFLDNYNKVEDWDDVEMLFEGEETDNEDDYTDDRNRLFGMNDDAVEYIVRTERAIYGGEHGDIIGTSESSHDTFDTKEEATKQYNVMSRETGEVVYLDFKKGDEIENLESVGSFE